MAILNPADIHDEVSVMSDIELADALLLSLLSTHDPDPEVQWRAQDRVHALRNEAQRRNLKLCEES